MMVTMLSINLTSCSNNDEDDGGNSADKVVGAWSKKMSDGSYVGCRFDANGAAYFDTWTNSPKWRDPGTWSVSGNEITGKSPYGVVAITATFSVSSDGKTLTLKNVQTPDEWKIFRNLEGKLTRM